MTPPAPPLWVTLAQLWRLDDREAWRCWRALYQAQWTVSAGFRQRLVLFEAQPAHQRLTGVDAFVREHLTPPDILAVLEALTAEGLLPRRDRIQIEERVLGCINSRGQWTYPLAEEKHS